MPAAPFDLHVGRIIRLSQDKLSIVLDPPELGALHVTLNGRKGKDLAASIVVDRPETLDLLRRESPTIERILSDAGLKLDPSGLQLSLRQDSPHPDGSDGRPPALAATGSNGDDGNSTLSPRRAGLSSARLLDLLA